METKTRQPDSSAIESPVIDIIRERRSRRAFLSNPIEPEKIKSLFEAARWAPSSLNDQPWMYLYATRQDLPELWKKLWEVLNPGNKVWTEQAPLLILSMARKHFINGAENGSSKYDLGGANAFLSLQGTAMGLNIHQMGGYDRARAIAAFNIPEEYELGVMLAIGYAGDPEALPENLKLRESAPRSRRTQDAFVMNKPFEKW